MANAIPREQVQDIAAGLQRLLQLLASGEMTAGPGLIARLEGAATVLKQRVQRPAG